MQLTDIGHQNRKSEIELDFMQYFRVIRRRKFSVILSTLVFVSFGIYYVLNSTPIYQATSKIQADPIQPNATAQDTYIMNSMVFLFYETQYEIIQSRKVAESVVDKLGLIERYKLELEESKASQDDTSWILDLKKGTQISTTN